MARTSGLVDDDVRAKQKTPPPISDDEGVPCYAALCYVPTHRHACRCADDRPVFVSKEEVEELATKNVLKERKKEAGDDSGWVAIGCPPFPSIQPCFPRDLRVVAKSFRSRQMMRKCVADSDSGMIRTATNRLRGGSDSGTIRTATNRLLGGSELQLPTPMGQLVQGRGLLLPTRLRLDKVGNLPKMTRWHPF
jgi:hypothetical protein